MRKLILGVAAIGFMAFATSAHAGFILSTGTTGTIPSNNDFKSNLNALGFDSFSQGAGTDLKLSTGGTVVFFKHGKEAGFTNTFNSDGSGSPAVSDTQSANFGWNGPGIKIGTASFSASSTLPWEFDSAQGAVNQGIGSLGFGIFFDSSVVTSGPTDIGNWVYFGQDDQSTNVDDNHDDFVISAHIVPEPATIGLLGMGLAGVGFVAHRRRKA